MKTFFGVFKWSFLVTAVALVAAYFYGGIQGLVLVAILGVLEISLSFDNALVNARVLEKMSEFWRKIFLTVGVLIAVVFMRFLLPLALVAVTTGLTLIQVVNLAFEKGNPNKVGTYGHYLHSAHPQIAAFGGMFLVLLFVSWLFAKKDINWLTWLEKPLERVGQLKAVPYLAALLVLLVGAAIAENPVNVLIAGILGIVTYILVDGLGSLFEGDEDEDEDTPGIHGGAEAIAESIGGKGPAGMTLLVGKAAFFSFLYLEVLDSSFSFDGAIGAFSITADPILIALGLGFIGAMFVRSLTVYLVREGTLDTYVYLDHGAHWAIGALSALLILSIGVEVPEVITGLIGAVLVVAAFISSVLRNKRVAREEAQALTE